MRTLKKTLALVLVVAMMMSLCITASAFEDADEIENVEAVDVLVALGIIKGYEDDTFRPEGTLTRAEAAVMIARLLQADDISGTAPFTDLAGYDWAEDAIAYCYSEGIVDGVGDGKFDPAGKLTGYAWAKMLLAALGYDADVTGMTGASWEIGVAKLAKSTGIFGDDVSDKTLACSRDAACAYAFNALFIEEVDYVSSGSDITIGDIEISANKYLVELGTYLKDSFKLASAPYVGYDGLNAHYWTVKGKAVTGLYVDDVYVASFAEGTTYGAVATALGITKTSTKTAQWYANGEAKGDAIAAASCVGSKAKLEAPIDVYVDALTGEYKLMATINYLAEVTNVTKLTGDNKGLDQVEFTVYAASNYTVTFGAEAEIATGTYTKGDVYVVVPEGDNSDAEDFLSIEAPEVVEGKVTGTGTGYVRVDGTKYTLHPFCEALSALDYNKSTFCFYMAGGYVIGYELKSTAPVAPSYDGILYLNDAEYSVTGASESLFGNVAFSAAAKAGVNFVGETATIDLAIYVASNPMTGAKSAYLGKDQYGMPLADTKGVATELALAEGWYYYNETAAGYVLTAVADANAADVTLEAKKASVIAGKYADADTVVNVYVCTTSIMGNTVAKTTYTGIAGYPAVAKAYTDAANTIVVKYVKNAAGADTNLIASIDIYNVTAAPMGTKLNYAMYVGAGEAYDAGKYYQGFFIDGEYVEYAISTMPGTSVTLTKGAVYDISLNPKGELQTATEITTMETGVVDYVGSTYVVIGGEVIYLADGYVVYNAAEDHAGEADAIEVGDTVLYNVANGKLAIAYITVEAE